MALRPAARAFTRRLSGVAERINKTATKGPKLPEGLDPSAYHGPSHALADTNRWRMISALFALPVCGFAVLQSMATHEHPEPPPDYPYLKMATRVPRFPWGNEDLIGTGYEHHMAKHGKDEHH